MRIGFDDPEPPTESRSPVFALQPGALRSQPERAVPLWALRLLAALALVVAVVVVALLIV